MFKNFRFISALGAVFFAVLGLAACGSSGIPGNAVVQVGGNPITKATYEHWLSVAAASSSTAAPGQTAPKPVVPDPPNYTACIAHLEATAPKPAKGQSKPTPAALKSQCEQQYKSLQQEVLGFLISSAWVLGEAENQGVHVSDAEVKKQFEQIKTQQFPKPEEFKKFLASSGQTVTDLLLRVKLNLLSSKIQQKVSKEKGTVTQAQIKKYYEEHKSQFGSPEKRNVKIILTKTEAAANKAKKEIESGKSFSSVAKAVSIDPTSKAKGGEITGVVKGQEEKALDEAIFSAPKGQLGGPVKTPFGYYIYEVTGTTKGNQQALTQAQASIKQQLTAQQQQQALSKFVKEFRTRWEGKTECRSGYVVQDCHEFKKPATPTGATPQTGAPAQTTSTATTPTK
ncbi:MAG TPA: peptidyl-prolyl cis-trans isomerase [Solirubrobacteraceae bacterium]